MKLDNFILFLIFLIIGLNLQSGLCYILFFLVCILSIVSILLKKRIHLRITFTDFIPITFLIVWFYGVCIGIYNQNKFEYIFANNAGMILYILYYVILQLEISRQKIYDYLLISSLSIACITFLLYILNTIGLPESISKILLGDFTGGSSTGQKRVYFAAQIALFPALSVYISSFIASNSQRAQYWGIETTSQKIKSIIFFLFYTICVVFFTASKGFMLGFLFILFTVPIALFYKRFLDGYINKKVLTFVFLIILLFGSLISLGYINIITAMFDNSDTANVLRYEQMYYLFTDLTFFGKGLGAVIPGYSRNLDKPYGFELSYLSLLHKFGILSLLLILLYIITLFKSFKNIIRGYNVKYAIISIGALCYLLPSIGNPLLFAPQAVVLNCLALYIMRKDKIYE